MFHGWFVDSGLFFLFLVILLMYLMHLFISHLVAPFDFVTVMSYPLLGISSCLCIVWLLNARRSVVAGFLSLLPVRAYGVLSYSVYIWHIAVLYFLHKYFGEMFANSSAFLGILYFFFFFFLVLAVACASYGFIERPFLRIKERYSVSGSANFFSWQRYLVVSFSIATVCFAALKAIPELVDKLGYAEAAAVGFCFLVIAVLVGQGMRWLTQMRRIAWNEKMPS